MGEFEPTAPDAHSALCAAAETLVGDGDLRRRLACNARAYAERTFDIGAVAARFEAVIRGAAELSQPAMCARYHS